MAITPAEFEQIRQIVKDSIEPLKEETAIIAKKVNNNTFVRVENCIEKSNNPKENPVKQGQFKTFKEDNEKNLERLEEVIKESKNNISKNKAMIIKILIVLASSGILTGSIYGGFQIFKKPTPEKKIIEEKE